MKFLLIAALTSLVGCGSVSTFGYKAKPYSITETYRECDKDNHCKLVTRIVKE